MPPTKVFLRHHPAQIHGPPARSPTHPGYTSLSWKLGIMSRRLALQRQQYPGNIPHTNLWPSPVPDTLVVSLEGSPSPHPSTELTTPHMNLTFQFTTYKSQHGSSSLTLTSTSTGTVRVESASLAS